MFSSRRFLAAFLIVTVLSAGFGLLPSSLVQRAEACGSGCEEAIQQCERMAFLSYVACIMYGDDDDLCIRAKEQATVWCTRMIEVCQN